MKDFSSILHKSFISFRNPSEFAIMRITLFNHSKEIVKNADLKDLMNAISIRLSASNNLNK